ncbi:MAG: glycine zipper 2TM domain-containing protein [Pseudomonadota bacterium]
MNAQIKIGAVSAMAIAVALPATAQQYRPTPEYQRQLERYEDQRERYEDRRERYEDTRADYREARRNYRQARRDYERRLAEWDRARAIYDRRHGYGAYARIYPRPIWDETYWTRYEGPPYAGYYGANASANLRCDDGNTNTVAGGIIGALAGAVLGSQVASKGTRTEGAVLGGLVGGGVGAAIGNSSDRKYRCDSRGPYFTYDDTVPYREGRQRYASSYDRSYYERQRCRLAPAPIDADGRDMRYVRVCPDGSGRYRITG